MNEPSGRLSVLDGWRGLSILLVLAAHLLPLGPKSWQLNFMAGVAGMSLFFSLSGFLIARLLMVRPEPAPFLVRRVLRIVPLAWLVLLLVLPLTWRQAWPSALGFLFVQNYVTSSANQLTSHYWSLCVEIHFYVAIAAMVAIGGKRALLCLPLLAVLVTLGRVWTGTHTSIATHSRVDEILSGATLALLLSSHRAPLTRLATSRFVLPVVLTLWALSCHPASGSLNYLRPYLAVALVGVSLVGSEPRLVANLTNEWLRYLAEISYAVYVIHGPLRSGWFSTGSDLEVYLFKRPLTVLLTFALAHLSTRYFERHFISLGKRLTS
jgi:peptidoglycan/LPS O-acetylase OafA/YrhL